jgi:hypothetical protein
MIMYQSKTVCSKGGVKIHETHNRPNNDNDINKSSSHYDQQEFFNRLNNEKRHTGVRIENHNNEYKECPFGGANPHAEKNPSINKVNYDKSTYQHLDLDLDNYSREDLFHLFGVQSANLSENTMREAKKIALKTHPDKSNLDPKFFVFFTNAYNRLYKIYEFQNKTSKQKQVSEDDLKYKKNLSNFETNLSNAENKKVLDNLFEKNKALATGGNFGNWFNEQFEKYKLDENNEGYGDWLKSNEGFIEVSNVTQANMNSEMEKKKKEIQALTKYGGITDSYASSTYGNSLMNTDNFSSGGLFSSDGMLYTDIKEAYSQTIIPVSEDDYHKMPKFNNIDEYNRHRNNMNVNPLSKDESLDILYNKNKKLDEESVAMAYYYAKQEEKVQKNQEGFWSSLKQLTFG